MYIPFEYAKKMKIRTLNPPILKCLKSTATANVSARRTYVYYPVQHKENG